MNFRLLAVVTGLRYRLLWAGKRTRGGKVALFLSGYLLVVFVGLLLSLGGYGAGIAALRAGRGELVSRVVLGGFFVTMTGASIALGAGMNAKFSDAAFRRYPMTAFERLVVRQGLAFLEPMWMIALVFNCGFSFGLYIEGNTNPWLGFFTALLLTVSNYLLARFVLTAISRLLVMRGGTLILFAVLLGVGFLPGILAQMLVQNRAWGNVIADIGRCTPPLAAAATMAGSHIEVWLPVLVAWIVALSGGIALIERAPEVVRRAERVAFAWDGPCDRVTRFLGPKTGPLVSKTLRYYLRNTRVRMGFLLSGPGLVVIFWSQTARLAPPQKFLMALPMIALSGFVASFAIAVNVFGYEAAGFRRYLLLPISEARVIRAIVVVPLVFGLAPIVLHLAAWCLFAPLPADAHMLTMLVSSALGGLLLLEALAIWTTLLAPRKTEFGSSFGNNLSFGGNVLFIGSCLSAIGGGAILARHGSSEAVLAWWWTAPLFVLFGAAALGLTLSAAPGVFASRRERLLALLEGKR